jgi:outer membrane protein TolC
MKKKVLFYLILFSVPAISYGQNLTIKTCQESARNNYPLVKQFGLIEKTAEYNISNANKAYLPQLNLTAKATYQSEVTKLPITIPGMTIPELTKDQYQAAVELSQLLWDGGVVKAQKKSIQASTEAEKQKLEVDLYALNERVNQLFFGIMLLNEQLIQLQILQNELSVNYKRVEAYKQNGVANQSDLDAIQVEQINASQRETEIKSTKKSFTEMLSAFTGLKLDETTVFEKPIVPAFDFNSEIKRPELSMLSAQNNLLETQRNVIIAGNLPKIGAFVQAGYGKPGLNMLTNAFSPFYIGGIRLSWNLSGFYTQKTNLDKIELNKKSVDIQKETFLFNNNLQNKQQQNEMEKLKSNIKNDDEIIRLRSNIKKSSEVKVVNGTATITDLLRDINAESMAKQNKLLHEIQLYMAVYQFKTITNN